MGVSAARALTHLTQGPTEDPHVFPAIKRLLELLKNLVSEKVKLVLFWFDLLILSLRSKNSCVVFLTF